MVVARISPTAQIYLRSAATLLALPAPWHLYQSGGGGGSRCYLSLIGDPDFRRWPVAVPTWVSSDFSNCTPTTGGKKEPGSFLGAFTWSTSPKGLIWPLFRGAWVTEEPPSNCLATGNNGAIVGGVECGQATGTVSAPRAGPRPEPACHTVLSPPSAARGRHILHPLPCLPGPSSWHQQHLRSHVAPVYVDMQTAMTLQEAGACGPGLVGVG